MLTVYFDTSFYLGLLKKDADAAQVIASLNALGVRCVLSDTLLSELGSSADRPDADHKLYTYVSALTEAPYCTRPGLTWDRLLVEGNDRRDSARALIEMDRALLEARSMSVVANADFPHGLRAAAVRHVVDQSPFTKSDSTPDLEALEALLVPIATWLGVVVPTPLRGDDLHRISAEIFAAVDAMGQLEPAETRRRLAASTVSTDNRPYEVVLGTATPKAKRSLANTFRDSAHMAEFAAHSHAIDVLQLDRAQHQQLTENAQHELRRLALDGRCFCAATPGDAVARVAAFSRVMLSR